MNERLLVPGLIIQHLAAVLKVLHTDQGGEELVIKCASICLWLYADSFTKAFSVPLNLKSSLCASSHCPPGPGIGGWFAWSEAGKAPACCPDGEA